MVLDPRILDLGKAVNQTGDLVSEEVADVFHGIIRILHHVVQQGGRNGLVPQAD